MPTIAHARAEQLRAAAEIERNGWDERGAVLGMADYFAEEFLMEQEKTTPPYIKPSDIAAKKARIVAASLEGLRKRVQKKRAEVDQIMAQVEAWRNTNPKKLRSLVREADVQLEMLIEAQQALIKADPDAR
jgi:hypothetical protein